MEDGVRLLLVGASLAFAAGCHGKDDGAGACTSDLVATEANDYSYTVDLTLADTRIGAEEDATLDWSAVTTDFRGRPLAPSDVSKVSLARFNLTHDETLAGVNSNGIEMQDIATEIEHVPAPGETSAAFSTFTISGVDGSFDPGGQEPNALRDDPGSTYVASLWRKNDVGKDEIVMSQFVTPTTGEASHTVAISDASATLEATADLHTPPHLCAVAGAPPYSLDWSAVGTDANGNPWQIMDADLLRIVHLPEEDISAVEQEFLQLDVAASETYYGYMTLGAGASPYGQQALGDLGKAESVDGATFPGFTEDGTWIVDLECLALGCFSPAPLLLVVVDVEAP